MRRRRARSAPSRSTSLLRTSQPAWPSIGADLDRAQRRRDRARRSAAVERVQARTPAERARPGSEARRSRHATIFTSRSGTTITLRGVAAVELPLDLVGRERERLGRRPVEPARRGQRVAQLAVDLDRERHLVLDQQRRIELGPGGVGDQPFAAEQRPRLPRRGAAPSARPAGPACGSPRSRVADGGAFSIALVSS